jgi:hypothetical protein
MIEKAYRPSRMKNGQRVVGRLYRGKFRLDPRDKIKYVALHTTDRQVAEHRLRKMVLDEQRERAGLIAPKRQREAAQRSLTAHLEDYIADLRAVGRDEKYVRELGKKLLRMIEECSWRTFGNITEESFCAWRSREKKSA